MELGVANRRRLSQQPGQINALKNVLLASKIVLTSLRCDGLELYQAHLSLFVLAHFSNIIIPIHMLDGHQKAGFAKRLREDMNLLD